MTELIQGILDLTDQQVSIKVTDDGSLQIEGASQISLAAFAKLPVALLSESYEVKVHSAEETVTLCPPTRSVGNAALSPMSGSPARFPKRLSLASAPRETQADASLRT